MIKPARQLENLRSQVAETARRLRRQRRWTQAELGRHLSLSQARLSEIERGDGSFSAEQFITLLQLFNADLAEFVPASSTSEADALQNSLARLGAQHLQENSDVLPSGRLRAATDVLRETLVLGTYPRLITGLAPVLVQHADSVNLHQLNLELARAGLQRRLGWMVENTVEALPDARVRAPRAWVSRYRVAEVILKRFSNVAVLQLRDLPEDPAIGLDVLDPAIRSEQSLRSVVDAASPISKRWRIATSIQPDDFVTALRSAHDAG